ncbi:MAG: 5-deoxy-glucuronate isomerase [Chloroflexia bacterium]|nr:5-deoxy-glucuronate isomerase [Chloroflexia bacterium]MDQ3410980.1 5-deoxy-glucuronate isomerase [Chloroflexota bacterium]
MVSSTAPAELLLRSARSDGSPGELINVTPERAGWDYTSLFVQRLEPGASWTYATRDDEVALVPLGGTCTVHSGKDSWTIGGRSSVFSGPPSALYLPRDSELSVTGETTVELAVCGARADQRREPVMIEPKDVAVEIRGAGNAARQINHIIKPGFPADRLLVVEVFTPSGNWSSYPPHKHDVSDLPAEADLEEIYYYRIDPNDGFAFQRLYTGDGTVDEVYIIRDGDLLLVPEGYHVFAVAHGYTGYYLNILAGNESVRTMQPADDPAYAWVRGTWRDEMNDGIHDWRDIERRVNGAAGKRA